MTHRIAVIAMLQAEGVWGALDGCKAKRLGPGEGCISRANAR